MRAGGIYVIQCTWRWAYVIEVDRVDLGAGLVYMKRVVNLREWRTGGGLESVAQASDPALVNVSEVDSTDPWDVRIVLELPFGKAARPGFLGLYQIIAGLEVEFPDAWRRRLEGKARGDA